MKKTTIIRIVLSVLIVYGISACYVSKVPKVATGKFITDNTYVSGNDTLLLNYNVTLNEVEVFTKNYQQRRECNKTQLQERNVSLQERELIASNVKIVQPTMVEWKENYGSLVLSEDALYSVIPSNQSYGRFTIYLIYSLSLNKCVDYGFSLSWFRFDSSLKAEDIENILKILRGIQFQYVGENSVIDEICLTKMFPIYT